MSVRDEEYQEQLSMNEEINKSEFSEWYKTQKMKEDPE